MHWEKQVEKIEKTWKRKKEDISEKSRKKQGSEKKGKNQVLDAFQQASSPNPY